MALGGGTFTAQNKALPGAYINFVSVKSAGDGLSSRGVATMPLLLDWGPNGVFEVSQDDFYKDSKSIFGYEYTADEMKNLRELFRNVTTLYAYNLQGGGKKAAAGLATAKYAGKRGNDLSYTVSTNVDDSTMYDVALYLGTTCVDTQTVAKAADLEDNDYVIWNDSASIETAAGTSLTGGTNAEVTGESYKKYLDAIESYTFNVMGIVTTDDATKKTAVNFVKRMRDDSGIKFQLVLFQYAADYEGVISVENAADGDDKAALVYWVTGAEAGCAVESSLMNTEYDGEYTVDTSYTQNALEKALKAGKFIMHRVNGAVKVLRDINTLVTYTDNKGDIFADNKTVRVCDQIGNDIASLFASKYIGKIPNDNSGRVSLWNDVVDLHTSLATLRAIEDFDSANITIEQGGSKNSVVITDSITVTGTMEQLYMTVKVA
jgi:hypothetical protein